MNFDIRYVDPECNEWDVKRAIAAILHTEAIFRPAEPGERQINFEVTLNKRPMGIRNDGTGTLTLPSPKVSNYPAKPNCSINTYCT